LAPTLRSLGWPFLYQLPARQQPAFRPACTFPRAPRHRASVRGISTPFGAFSPSRRQVSYVLLTRAPLSRRTVRLACVRHAASVHPEPGSNSPYWLPSSRFCLHISVVKLRPGLCHPVGVFRRISAAPSVVNAFLALTTNFFEFHLCWLLTRLRSLE